MTHFRSVGLARSTDPVGFSADSRTRIHCHDCAGASQPALAPTWMGMCSLLKYACLVSSIPEFAEHDLPLIYFVCSLQMSIAHIASN